ncbi:Protein NRT1/ PTR FAMILY 6.2 [Bienertia sinuspersici]
MSLIHEHAFDYKGFPANKSKTGGWIAAVFILGIELCERLSTMGIAVNLVTYLAGSMHLSSSESANIVTDFMGTSFLLCFLGGFLADSFLGRFRTVAISAIIQTIGTGLLAVSTRLPTLQPPPCDITSSDKCEPANSFQMGILYFSLYLIALGTGGLKSSVSGFGADQFDESDEKEKANLAYFFNRFFFFISTGTLVAVTVLVYVQDEVSRSLAYAICSASMFIANFAFFFGTKQYRYQRSHGSPIAHILQVIVAATNKRRLNLPYNTDLLYEKCFDASRIHHTNQFRFLDKAAITTEDDHVKDGVLNCNNPWKLCSVTRVEELKAMIRLMPIWATTILFWTNYAQMLTFSVEQAGTMRRSIGGFQIPAASLTVFFVLAVLITLAVNDRVVIPLWKKCNGKAGLTNLQRISLGLLLSAIGMAAAALSELKRRSVLTKATSETSVLPVSVFLLVPQFLLVGAGEAFTYTGQLDFFITEAPRGMKGLSTGLFLVTISLGFFVSSFLVTMIQKVTSSFGTGEGWIGNNINKGRLDYFLWTFVCVKLHKFWVVSCFRKKVQGTNA